MNCKIMEYTQFIDLMNIFKKENKFKSYNIECNIDGIGHVSIFDTFVSDINIVLREMPFEIFINDFDIQILFRSTTIYKNTVSLEFIKNEDDDVLLRIYNDCMKYYNEPSFEVLCDHGLLDAVAQQLYHDGVLYKKQKSAHSI